MLAQIRNLIFSTNPAADQDASTPEETRLRLCCAVLLVETAVQDGDFGSDERAIIHDDLRDRFGLTDSEADELIDEAQAAAREAVEHYSFTRDIKNALSEEDRIALMERMWEIAYADGELHDYEAHLARRMAGQLYVGDRESGLARKRVLERLGLAD